MQTSRRKKHPVKRIIKGIILTLIAILLYVIIGGYAPFIRCPEVTDINALKARAQEMSQDIESADRASILETNLSALDERIRLMAQAEEEIIITSYDMRDGESTRDIMAVALHRAEEGVKVRILVDGISGLIRFHGNDMFAAVAAHPNIEVRIYNLLNPALPWKTMGRMHDKYVIADDKAFILGGRNMFDYFIGDYPTDHRSHDREVLIYNGAHGTPDSSDSALFQVRAYFEEVWNLDVTTVFGKSDPLDETRREAVYQELSDRYADIRAAKPSLFEPYDYAAATEPTHGVWLISNPTTIYAKEPVAFQQLYELMLLAEHEVIIHSPYAVLNGYMQSALTEIAANVPTTLMINAVENGDNMVASSDYTYHKGDVVATGVQLLEYAGGESYHGKSIAIDGNISIIGSFNFDLRSTYVDTELMLVIRSETVNAQLRENMSALHADCRQVVSTDETIVPEGLEVPEVPAWKRMVWYVLGAAMQLVRNLV